MKLNNTALSLRPITPNDTAFLRGLYASTRAEEMKRVPNWTDLMKDEFLTSQFEAQHEHYQKNYTGADFWVIEFNNQKIGRLYLHENFQGRGMRIIDISILPEFRNRGLGQGILKDLMGRATDLERPLTIHVESFNPARDLYTRLGFKKISDTNGIYQLMEWKHTI